MDFNKKNIAIIGLGYVGLPLAVEFGKNLSTVGFDINKLRIDELKTGVDKTLEVAEVSMKEAVNLRFSYDTKDLIDCEIYIITVPTPIDDAKRPDLSAIIKASEMVAKVLKEGDIVIYLSLIHI